MCEQCARKVEKLFEVLLETSEEETRPGNSCYFCGEFEKQNVSSKEGEELFVETKKPLTPERVEEIKRITASAGRKTLRRLHPGEGETYFP